MSFDSDTAAGRDRLTDESAEWKNIQKSAFSRWANERLKASSLHVDDLQTDLSDGVCLIALVEALSGSKLSLTSRQRARPATRTQKLEIVTVCLNFLERHEGVRIINIDSGDIVDGKMKLILGLMWTLILHYSMSSSNWNVDSSQGDSDKSTAENSSSMSPKQRLLAWIRDKIGEDRPVNNFTTDWKDGKTLGALVSATVPGACEDWRNWDEENSVQNTREAMNAATQHLNVAELITPEEMCDPNIDEYSIMTYLSQYPCARLNPNVEVLTEQVKELEASPTDETDDVALKAALITAFGDGLSVGNVGHPARFTVMSSQLTSPPLQVNIDGPAKVKLDQQDIVNGYQFEYITPVEGSYVINIMYDDAVHIPGSPFRATFTETTIAYRINVYTGTVFGAGTDANVYIVLIGEIGDTGKIPLKSSKTHMNKFERGQRDEFTADAVNIGELRKIRIGHDGMFGLGADWFLDKVVIDAPFLRRQWVFPCEQWLGKGVEDGVQERELCAQPEDENAPVIEEPDKSTEL